MSGRGCPECGVSMEGRKPNAIYCGRSCQVRALNRQRKRGGGALRITLDPDTRHRIDQAAYLAVLSTRRYVELLIEQHAKALPPPERAT